MNFAADIPLSAAIAAYQGTSFVPEKSGQMRVDAYAKGLAADYEHFKQHAEKGGTLDLLDAEFARYREGVKQRTLAYLGASSRCVSTVIAGPSNFPVRRMQKRIEVAHRRLNDLCDFQARARRAIISKLRPDLAPIRASDADAVERLQQEIDKAERVQERMKAANKAIRENRKLGEAAQVAALVVMGFSESMAREALKPDFCGRIGFPDYALKNNGANIRRMQARLEQIKKLKALPDKEFAGAVATIEDAPSENRVRLRFPGKPDEAVRSKLKACGFRWAPTLGVWQAYRNGRSLGVALDVAQVAGAR